ncbi:MAG: DNA alkylation repair protein [Clostridia bacterium]|nr:DNA alkylation repair protein [Clostridia bacterium]
MDTVIEKLFEMQDTTYRDFHSKLMPEINKERIIGVRTPALRSFAKQLSGTDEAAAFIKKLPHQYYEENNLHAFLIEQIKNYDTCISELEKFFPFIDNWATCDMLRPKIFAKHLPELKKQCFVWLSSADTYTVRFAIETLMLYFLDGEFDLSIPEKISEIRSDKYYVRMMVAWYFATALAKQYSSILPYIEQNRLDPWIHNKTIQKARESRRITSQQKEYLATLKITF